ncbi:MAG: helix-hairpin-helix domain-containing protein [Nitrospirota bacterium]
MKSRVLYRISRVVLVVFFMNMALSGLVFAESADVKGKIDINQATEQELAKLSGIGEKKAADIVTYRNENGKFSSVDDLLKIKGIGKKTLDKIRDSLTVTGG